MYPKPHAAPPYSINEIVIILLMHSALQSKLKDTKQLRKTHLNIQDSKSSNTTNKSMDMLIKISLLKQIKVSIIVYST